MENEEILENLYLEYECALDKAKEYLKSEFLQIRAGRANPHILDKVLVNYYGAPTPLNQIANISVQDARMLVISCWDQSAVKEAVKAIIAADLGITPSDDGKVIRMVFQSPTEERRRELVKNIRKLCEDAKITGRNARRDILEGIKKMKKEGCISEDEQKCHESDIQKMLDKYTAEIDSMGNDKEKEIMTI